MHLVSVNSLLSLLPFLLLFLFLLFLSFPLVALPSVLKNQTCQKTLIVKLGKDKKETNRNAKRINPLGNTNRAKRKGGTN